MKTKILFLTLLLYATACNSDDSITDLDTTPEETRLVFSENANIVISSSTSAENIVFANISEGNAFVFEYTFIAGQSDSLSDDEFFERIIFEIDPQLSSFSFTNEELTNINTFYNRSCFCANIGSLLIDNGTISGTRISETEWDIDFNLTFVVNGNEMNRSNSGIYIPKDISED